MRGFTAPLLMPPYRPVRLVTLRSAANAFSNRRRALADSIVFDVLADRLEDVQPVSLNGIGERT